MLIVIVSPTFTVACLRLPPPAICRSYVKESATAVPAKSERTVVARISGRARGAATAKGRSRSIKEGAERRWTEAANTGRVWIFRRYFKIGKWKDGRFRE